MERKEREASASPQSSQPSFLETASRIMLAPIRPSSTKAIQWSKTVMLSRNWIHQVPSRASALEKPPNHRPIITMFRGLAA